MNFKKEREIYLYELVSKPGFIESTAARYKNNPELLSIIIYPRTSNELEYAQHYLNYSAIEQIIFASSTLDTFNIPMEENTAIKFIVELKELFGNEKALKKYLSVFDINVTPDEYANLIFDSISMLTYDENKTKRYINLQVGSIVDEKTYELINNTLKEFILPPTSNIYITKKQKEVERILVNKCEALKPDKMLAMLAEVLNQLKGETK